MSAIVGDAYATNEAWFGSYYELAIQLGHSPDDQSLAAAMSRLWSAPPIAGGPWPTAQDTTSKVMPALVEAEGMQSTYGLLNIEGYGPVRFASWVIREVGRRADWIDVSIPTQALTEIESRDGAPSRRLLNAVDDTLLAMAEHIYATVKFAFAVVGEEVSGMWSAETIATNDLRGGGFLLPAELFARLGRPEMARPISPSLFWVPSTFVFE